MGRLQPLYVGIEGRQHQGQAIAVVKPPTQVTEPLPPLAKRRGLRRMRAGYAQTNALRGHRSLQRACQAQQIIPIGAKAV